MRSRQQAKLEEFADDNRLEYKELPLSDKQKELPNADNLARLRISLVPRTKPIDGIVDITPAEDF